ncbi:MAG: hypothetical protein U0802_04010 [Candidatus Binatia bacterium]
MKERYSRWRAGALAVIGCALGAVLAGAPAQAQCVGDCNGDGMVAINELIIGVNIALGSAQVSACPSFDVNNNGEVAINELITAVNNALGSCPVVDTPTVAVPTDTPIEIPTETPTLPAGTATATLTPTATPVPAEPLGKQVCTLTGDSQLFLQTVALPLPLTPTGTFSIDCGAPGADGTAACDCKLMEFGAVVIPAIGDVCVNPAEGCDAGTIDCNGGSTLDVSLDANHNIGMCDSQAACTSSCDAYCGSLGQGVTRQSSGCEGYCSGGSSDGASCDRDSDCPGGNCTGGEPVTHFDVCNCVCSGTRGGPAGGAGSMFCNLGTQINVELPPSSVCGDKPANIQLAPVCGPVTSETSVGQVSNANNQAGATIPAANPPSVVDGAAVSCDSFKAGNITGLKLVGQLGFFDSTLGDIRSGNSFVCQ